jgi:hypothetical protein
LATGKTNLGARLLRRRVDCGDACEEHDHQQATALCVCVSILWCVCDTDSRYTHGQENTVCGTPFRLDDDQLDLAADARHARVWRGGARTGRHDGLASRPLRNVEPALRARTSAKLSRWRTAAAAICTSLADEAYAWAVTWRHSNNASFASENEPAGGEVVVVVVVYPHVLLLFVAGSNIGLSRAPLSPSDSAPLDFSPRSYARLPYLIRVSSLELQPAPVVVSASSSQTSRLPPCMDETLAPLPEPRACESVLAHASKRAYHSHVVKRSSPAGLERIASSQHPCDLPALHARSRYDARMPL